MTKFTQTHSLAFDRNTKPHSFIHIYQAEIDIELPPNT